MTTIEGIIPPIALQAPKLTESHLSIALSALETKRAIHSVDGIIDITIRMFETHRQVADSSEVFTHHAEDEINYPVTEAEGELDFCVR